MQLIGMLDSPYVRRVAISLLVLGVPFKHRSLSVFRTFDQFQQINPVVKAPTAVTDDGVVLMDSTLILQYAEALVPSRSLLPASAPALARDLRVIGLSLAACEKAVQIIYERSLRPSEKRHEPWVNRVTGQLSAAFDALESCVPSMPPPGSSSPLSQAVITTAVTWQFCHATVPELASPSRYAALSAFSATAEGLPEFLAAPHGDGTVEGRG